MTEASRLAAYVSNNIPLKPLGPPLLHPSLCILDAVYSAQQHYTTRVIGGIGGGVIGRYLSYQGIARARGGRLQAGEREDRLIDLIGLIIHLGPGDFAKDVIRNETRQLGRQANGKFEKPPYRSQVCLKLAQMLLAVEPTANNMSGLTKWAEGVDLDDKAYRSCGKWYVKGVGYDTWHYLCMLAGNENLVKPDVHITKFVRQVLGYKPTKPEIVRLLQEAATILKISPKELDHSIWSYVRNNPRQSEAGGCSS